MQDTWNAVERYITDSLFQHDSALESALKASDAAGLPQIQVAANEGRLLQLLARSINAKRILEIGTLGGYSTIWLARSLPHDGRLTSIEVNPTHADVARKNVANAGLAKIVQIRVGAALEVLPQIELDRLAPFDFTFIDADKANIPAYFTWALKLSQPGSIIVVDNVVRDGAVVDASSTDVNVQGVRKLNELIATIKRVSATTIQTVGSKGYDGFTLALVIG